MFDPEGEKIGYTPTLRRLFTIRRFESDDVLALEEELMTLWKANARPEETAAK